MRNIKWDNRNGLKSLECQSFRNTGKRQNWGKTAYNTNQLNIGHRRMPSRGWPSFGTYWLTFTFVPRALDHQKAQSQQTRSRCAIGVMCAGHNLSYTARTGRRQLGLSLSREDM